MSEDVLQSNDEDQQSSSKEAHSCDLVRLLAGQLGHIVEPSKRTRITNNARRSEHVRTVNIVSLLFIIKDITYNKSSTAFVVFCKCMKIYY